MPVEMLTYADLGERLKISPEAARALVKRHRLPRSRPTTARRWCRSTSPKSAIPHRPSAANPGRSPGGHRPEAENRDPASRTDRGEGDRQRPSGGFERECERTNKLLAELLKTTSESMGARERAALLEGKLSMLTQPWRRRLADAFSLALPQVATPERWKHRPIA